MSGLPRQPGADLNLRREEHDPVIDWSVSQLGEGRSPLRESSRRYKKSVPAYL